MTPLSDWTMKNGAQPKILAGSVCLIFYIVILTLLFRPPPQEGKDVLLILIGAITSQFIQIISYFFGSSAKEVPTKGSQSP
jgi:hypothetical protein